MRLDLPFEEGDAQKFRQAFGEEVDVGRLAQIVARAGARETLAQATGEAVFSGMRDLKLFRIFCLFQEGLGMSEAETAVAGLFKVPSAEAKRYVNAAVARYKIQLDAKVRETVVGLLEGAAWSDQGWDMRMPSMFVRERVSDLLEGMDEPMPAAPQRGSIWRFADETYQALRGKFGLQPRAKA